MGWLMAAVMLMTAIHNGDEFRDRLYPALTGYVENRVAEFDQIADARKEQLRDIARYITECAKSENPVRVMFVCTHNSRRSHLAQLWAQTAAAYYGTGKFQAYSGGTEATAFNPRAVDAAMRVGFKVEKTTDDENPIFHVRFSDTRPPLTCFSKVHNQSPNPRTGFCVVMVCSEADRACPAVPGATVRVVLPFDDPKSADGTKDESMTYDERCRQIAREILYVFSVANSRTHQ